MRVFANRIGEGSSIEARGWTEAVRTFDAGRKDGKPAWDLPGGYVGARSAMRQFAAGSGDATLAGADHQATEIGA